MRGHFNADGPCAIGTRTFGFRLNEFKICNCKGGITHREELSKQLISDCSDQTFYNVTSYLNIKIQRMASGADHLLLLDVLGQVHSLGCAESGQLGRVSEPNIIY